jgi:leucyl aminopeptidase
MEKMKYDMAGAATMLGAITAIARLGIKQRVSCLLGLVENMPSGSATRPGDIVQAMNGKTIEVINTDAEGRLVLADALTHAVRRGATHLIDAATLTGAVSVALGAVNIGLLGNDASLSSHLTVTGQTIGEHFWSLPMNDEYLEPMKGDLSDLRNAGTDRKAGTITAAKFLEQFVDNTPWAHLDIAGTANLDKRLPNAPKAPRASRCGRWCAPWKPGQARPPNDFRNGSTRAPAGGQLAVCVGRTTDGVARQPCAAQRVDDRAGAVCRYSWLFRFTGAD